MLLTTSAGDEKVKRGRKPKRPSDTGGKQSQKKERVKEQPVDADISRRRKARGIVCFLIGLLLVCLSVFPGESFWNVCHRFSWSMFGLCLWLWIGYLIYCSCYWMRNLSVKENLPKALGPVLLFISVGTMLFLMSHSEEDLKAVGWAEQVSSLFPSRIGESWNVWTAMSNGGLVSAVLGATLAALAGKFAAVIVTCFLVAGGVLLSFPGARENMVNALTGRMRLPREKDAPDGKSINLDEGRPDTEAMPANPRRGGKPQMNRYGDDSYDELSANLDAMLQPTQDTPPEAPEPQGRFGRGRRAGAPTMEQVIPSMAIEVFDSGDEDAAKLVDSVFPEQSARKKALKGGDEAQSQIDALMKDAIEVSLNRPEEKEYSPPPLSCLNQPRATAAQPDRGEEDMIARKLLRTLDSFGVAVDLVGRSRGPSVTRYELRPAEGVKISKITALSDDIALRLAATKVRIEAPIPGKPAVGVEVPNRVRAVVTLRELVDSDNYRAGTAKSMLTCALGKDIIGSNIYCDLAKLPHLLIAGTTGSGKSVCMNTLILSLLYNASPRDVRLLMVDPKQVEFNVYSGIPHLLVPVVSDPLKAAGALSWAVCEMERRYAQISEQNVRDLDSYNTIAAKNNEKLEHMPRIVIFIDELSDLMMVAPSEVEDAIQRLAQKGRAAGIHLVLATQRPSVDVITGVIKSNLPGRIALSVASQIDSRTIINSSGAEQLLGNGDMLFSLNGGNNAIRVQGCYVSDAEVIKVVRYVQNQSDGKAEYDDGVWAEIERNAAITASGRKRGGLQSADADEDGEDPALVSAAIEVVVEAQMASTTMLQKKLKLGYARASRLVDELEAKGIVGPPEGSKPRKVLMSHAQWLEYTALAPDKRAAALTGNAPASDGMNSQR
ncbi:MAG: DNA translocase FtsK [Oscillospiraceae bacterium]|nr:DNA translocase FtsK [Oscillospiraceae bacterium]